MGGIFNCPLPTQQSVVNPFFSNIRQNMDLVGGVGEIPIHLPKSMGAENVARLPQWLKQVACDPQGSKIVADRFLQIEKAEQRRMQDALNVSVDYDAPESTKTKPHTLAGVEKGTKNRYNNIWPYDHARVKLQDYPVEECDYVNASHVGTARGQKKYIACQAPMPSTFRVSNWYSFRIAGFRSLIRSTGLLGYGLGAGCASDRDVDSRGGRRTHQESQLLEVEPLRYPSSTVHTGTQSVLGAESSQRKPEETVCFQLPRTHIGGLEYSVRHSAEVHA